MRQALTAALLLLPALAGAQDYALRDAGDFAPAGYRVEFADRFGWKSYRVDFRFGLDEGGRALTRGSKLKVDIDRLDGRTWSYTCKAKGRDPMTSNINFLYGKGISVVVTCPIPDTAFAKAVDLDAADVGLPRLVFEAFIQDGLVSAGAQRGLYFHQAGQIDASDLAAYAASPDPDGLAVLFRSN